MRSLFALLAIVLVVGCMHADTARVEPIHYAQPIAVLSLHVDESFSPRERVYIAQAVENLEHDSAGLIRVNLSWDVDFDDSASLDAVVGKDLLVKIDSNSGPVLDWRIDHPDNILLGLTVYPHAQQAWTVVYLVADQLDTEDMYVSVGMHEMLHALGLRHVADPFAVMAAGVMEPSPTCLHKADIVELCHRYGCEPKRIGWCGP